MQHIKDLLPGRLREQSAEFGAAYFRARIPQLDTWNLSDEVIEIHRTMLLEYLRQREICRHCTGFANCGKAGDMQGFEQVLEPYGNQLAVAVRRCEPYQHDQAIRRVTKFQSLSGAMDQDSEYQFANFPPAKRRQYPKLLEFAEQFADTYEQGKPTRGIYLFGPPGVGKTHLVLAVINRLQDRGIPCLFIRSDSVFDRMRQMIAENADLETFLEACATVPVLAIDEFAQERANEFTLEKLFRIVNHRFHAKLPTWFTSNYAPPDIYRKNGADLQESVAPLRSRILQMTKMARMEGEDARQRFLESLT